MIEQEEWRQVADFPYEVSNMGRIRRSVAVGHGSRVGRIRKPSCHVSGYLYVALYRGGKIYSKAVHRLVATAFLGPRPAGLETNHKNGVKTDSRASNLEYLTGLENARHAVRIGLLNDRSGEKNGRAKLREVDVQQIRTLASHVSRHQLAERFNVSRKQIGWIIRGLAWSGGSP